MPLLTDLTGYADAHRHWHKDKLWELFDGTRERLNITHECLGRHPRERIAVQVAHSNGQDDAFTFGSLADDAARFARWLSRGGHEPGDRIAIMLEPSRPFYAALFGAMQAGCVAVPLFTLFGPDGLRLRIDDCAPTLVVTNVDKAPMVRKAFSVPVTVADEAFLEELPAAPATLGVETSADDMAMYQYTSGTTRELPDAVKHRHRALVTVMLAALYGTGVRPGDRFMCPSSPAWGHGLWHGTLAPLAMGVTIAAYSGPFDSERLMHALQEFKISNLSVAATHLRMIKNSGRAGEFQIYLNKLTFTGEPIDSNTAEWAKRIFRTPACSMYGTTEVGVILANYPGAPDYTVRSGALGKPLPGLDVAVFDPQGRRCKPGETGEIMVRRGKRWIPTRDRGHIDSDGYFFHGGRVDDAIISAGWTMSAVEIEDVLLKHPEVREAAVIGVPDTVRGQVVKAFIVSDRPGDPEFVRELQAFTQERLSRHEYPRQIAFTDTLPKNPAGKVNRKALRDRESHHS